MISHIRTFRAYFHVSNMFFFSVAKRPFSFTIVAPRTCGAGNFVDDVALIYFFRGLSFGRGSRVEGSKSRVPIFLFFFFFQIIKYI